MGSKNQVEERFIILTEEYNDVGWRDSTVVKDKAHNQSAKNIINIIIQVRPMQQYSKTISVSKEKEAEVAHT